MSQLLYLILVSVECHLLAVLLGVVGVLVHHLVDLSLVAVELAVDLISERLQLLELL